jgi:hypothetical protein
MRPWLYATDWSYQFEIIDERVKDLKTTVQDNVFGGIGLTLRKSSAGKPKELKE